MDIDIAKLGQMIKEGCRSLLTVRRSGRQNMLAAAPSGRGKRLCVARQWLLTPSNLRRILPRQMSEQE